MSLVVLLWQRHRASWLQKGTKRQRHALATRRTGSNALECKPSNKWFRPQSVGQTDHWPSGGHRKWQSWPAVVLQLVLVENCAIFIVGVILWMATTLWTPTTLGEPFIYPGCLQGRRSGSLIQALLNLLSHALCLHPPNKCDVHMYILIYIYIHVCIAICAELISHIELLYVCIMCKSVCACVYIYTHVYVYYAFIKVDR